MRTVANSKKEVEKVRKATEEKMKEEFFEEMKKVQQKHKIETSAIKKKQWVQSILIYFNSYYILLQYF